jgi:hypothetical protein
MFRILGRESMKALEPKIDNMRTHDSQAFK